MNSKRKNISALLASRPQTNMLACCLLYLHCRIIKGLSFLAAGCGPQQL